MSGEERTRAANAFAAAASAFRADRVSLSPPPVPTLAARAGREDMCARGRRLLYMCRCPPLCRYIVQARPLQRGTVQSGVCGLRARLLASIGRGHSHGPGT